MKSFQSFLTLFLIFSISFPALGERIKLEDSELDQDSFLPYIYDKKTPIVQNRIINQNGRFSLGGGFVHQSTDLFYKQIAPSFLMSYNPSGSIQYRLDYQAFSNKKSKYSQTLASGDVGKVFDIARAPLRTHSIMFSYSIQPSYGKISLSKNSVFNLTQDYSIGLGAIVFKDGGQFPALGFGVGQNFFFSKNVSLRFNLGGMLYSGPNLADVDPSNASGIVIPSSSKKWPKSFQIDTSLSSSLVIGL